MPHQKMPSRSDGLILLSGMMSSSRSKAASRSNVVSTYAPLALVSMLETVRCGIHAREASSPFVRLCAFRAGRRALPKGKTAGNFVREPPYATDALNYLSFQMFRYPLPPLSTEPSVFFPL